ncbi:MAG: phosphate/phosphite/phosphonate ABC transporter substrate-binding protein [Gammaproteobacteria bacterium]
MNTLFRLSSLVALSCLLALSAFSAGAQSGQTYGSPGKGRVLVIGSVTTDPKYTYGRMQGIAEYVLSHMDDIGVDAVEVFTVDKPDKMIRLLRDGRVDWVSATPFTAVRYVDEANGQIILAKQQSEKAWYESVFFTRKDSGLQSLEDLVGKTIAFEKPTSTSAYFIPVSMIHELGLPLVPLDNLRAKPPRDAIGYVFSGEEANSSLWVHKKLVDAAVYSDADWTSEWILPGSLRDELRIFARSDRLPRSVEIVSSALPEAISQRLSEVLLAAADDADAAGALDQYYRATGFSEFTAEMAAALDGIREQIDVVTGTTRDSSAP